MSTFRLYGQKGPHQTYTSNSTSGYTHKRIESRVSKRYLYTNFIAALFTIAKTWKQPKCPSIDEWISKMWHIHTMEYYSAIKRKEILTSATAWMNPEDIMLSEISQSQKDKYCMIPLTWGTHWADKFLETESRIVAARASGKWRVGYNGYRVSVLQDEKNYGDGSGDGYKILWVYLIPLSCTLRMVKNGKFYIMCILTQ